MELIIHLTETLKQESNSLKARPMAAYMKNKFPFLGIQKPQRALIQKDLFKKYPLKTEEELIIVLRHLWELPEREYQYSACDLAYRYKNLWTPVMLEEVESFIRTKSWWDTVDILASKMVGTLIVEEPTLKKFMDHWIEDENFWIRRTALIYQLSYKEATDKDRLFEYCEKTMHEKEFFMRKAIGWSLRQYAKTNPEAVKLFISEYKEHLSPLSYREAGKYCLKLS